MRNPFTPGVGGVLSADIAVPDHDRELAFYKQVLTTGRTPLWKDDLSNNRGTPVIGLGARVPEYEALPLQWMPHFQVADIAESAKRTLQLGGQELMHGKDDDGHSQWAVLADPEGAAFGIVPVVTDESFDASGLDGIGRICWLSLVAADVPSICNFYRQVVGWSAAAETKDTCEMRRPDGVAAAEIRHRNEGESVPSVWILHLSVGDFDESLRQVREGGGEIVKEADVGYAVIRDPVGVYIAIQGKH